MPAPIAAASADDAGTEMASFRSAASNSAALAADSDSNKPQAWLPQSALAQPASHSGRIQPYSQLPLAAPHGLSSAILSLDHPASSWLSPSSQPAVIAASTSLTPSTHLRNASLVRGSPARRSARQLSAALNPSSATSLLAQPREGHARTVSPLLQSASSLLTANAALSSGATPSMRPLSAQQQQQQVVSLSSAGDALEGYTVIDIRSLPPSLSSSPAHSPAASPQPTYRVKSLRVDTAQLMAAAASEDVSPRTALFLAMKQKARADKKKARKQKDKAERERDKAASTTGGSLTTQPAQTQASVGVGVFAATAAVAGVAGERHTLQPYSSRSVSSSLHSLSLSPELSSLSASMSASPRSSLSRGSVDDSAVRDERRLKKEERRRLGYKLCRVSGCMEARGRDDDGHQHKYCRAHLGIHTQNNPNNRKKAQRDGQ